MDRDLERAVQEASKHLDARGEPRPGSVRGPGGRETPSRLGARRRRALLIVLGLAAAAVVLAIPTPSGGPQPPDQVEADLRWSVAKVVTEVERLRMVRGRLPEPEEIQILLSDAVEYEHFDGLYLVVGERQGVRVEFDGSLPLAEWQALELYDGGNG